MQVIEEHLASKNGSLDACEDTIFFSDDFVVVIDGTTSKSTLIHDNKKPGRVAVELALSYLPHLRPTATKKEVFFGINHAIVKWYKGKGLYRHMKKHHVDRLTIGGVVVYSKHFNELWLVGDCQALVDNRPITNEKLIDHLFTNVRSYYLESEMMQGKTAKELLINDTGRKFIDSLIMRQFRFQNLEGSIYGFGVIDGFFTNTSWVKVIKVPEGTKQIALVTDGYPEVFPTLKKTENRLKKILSDDPLMFKKYKYTKRLREGFVSYDDRAYVRFSLDR
jgi:glycerophosphoryl diester phosphodiesterase